MFMIVDHAKPSSPAYETYIGQPDLTEGAFGGFSYAYSPTGQALGIKPFYRTIEDALVDLDKLNNFVKVNYFGICPIQCLSNPQVQLTTLVMFLEDLNESFKFWHIDDNDNVEELHLETFDLNDADPSLPLVDLILGARFIRITPEAHYFVNVAKEQFDRLFSAPPDMFAPRQWLPFAE